MDRDHELGKKVDQLVGKSKDTASDRNIPVLTDLIDAPVWKPAPVLDFETTHVMPPVFPSNAPTYFAMSPPETVQPEILNVLSDEEIDQLSQDIFTRVSSRIDAELATALEARLSEQLQTQLHTAINHVLADMKMSIANEIGDAVNAALADRLRNK